jgi:hypothetical protein
MDLPRKIGIGIVMIIPTFVGGVALWDIFGGWVAASIWIVVMAAVSRSIISSKMASR